ncbi:hypothetical protein NQ318_019410 [Aromia moschata]|uniref:Transposase n=1 Tax=Aromia moschata TaxID=1265417 RepID=A0AAV8XJC4_9CUCU|nr:hypothetical protein NQ318_019410 [Aromia moschata]
MEVILNSYADADGVEGEAHQDILTCGVCQKPFALSDIVRFIQHKVTSCNKENFGQCYASSERERDNDDGALPLSTINTRRPSISAPISGKKVAGGGGRVHTPPPASPRLPAPGDLCVDGAASSTPKRRASSPMTSSSPEEDVKPSIKQEKIDVTTSSPEEHSCKRSRTEVADAESNTTHSVHWCNCYGVVFSGHTYFVFLRYILKMAGNKLSVAELEKMSPNDLYVLIDDIPSDVNSEIDDKGEDDDEDPSLVDQNFDTNNIPIIFEDELCDLENDGAWESEDELPLSEIRGREISKTTDSGPNISKTSESPLDVFLQIFPLDLIEHIVFQTNLYMFQKTGSSGFIHTNAKEMSTFLGINLLMGIKKLPSYLDYWSCSELRDQFISSNMSRDRFKWLLGNLHANDNSLIPLRGNCYNPSKHEAIDESMIRFKGRSNLKQYMPLKPINRGYRVWLRADSSGYVCQFQIYTGRVAETPEKDLGGRVVRDLTRVLVGKGHHIYFDNYFNSVNLQKDLQSHLIYWTVKQGRQNLPTDISHENDLKRGESEYRVSLDGIVYMKWKDRKGSAGNSLGKNYNKHMGYVDKFDMLKSIYEIDRKSKKWWHRIFWYLLDAAVVNAFLIFQERAKPKSMPLKMFRLSVALGFVGSESSCPKKGR